MAPTGPERGQTVQAPSGPRPGGNNNKKCNGSAEATEVLKSDFEKEAGIPCDPTKLLSSMSLYKNYH